MKSMLLLLLMVPFLAFGETVKIHVPGMVCQMCVQGMQAQFKDVVKDKEKDIDVDLDTKIVIVKTIDSISDEAIKERVQNAGYNAEKIERIKSE